MKANLSICSLKKSTVDVVAVSCNPLFTQLGDKDTGQFDSRFAKLTPFDSPVDARLCKSINLHFKTSEL